MSFAANQARLMLLIASQYDVELQMQFLYQHKSFLGRIVGGFLSMKESIEPGSQKDRMLQARIHQLNEAEKILEVRLENLKKRNEALGNERNALSQLIDKNSQRTFGNSWGGGGR